MVAGPEEQGLALLIMAATSVVCWMLDSLTRETRRSTAAADACRAALDEQSENIRTILFAELDQTGKLTGLVDLPCKLPRSTRATSIDSGPHRMP